MEHVFVVLAYKESPHLEDCIKSVLNQSNLCSVIIATSTPNSHISSLAKKHNLEIIVSNRVNKGIGYDFDFALFCTDYDLVTIAHQDDIYDYDYSSEICRAYRKYPDAVILFPNYYEIREEKKLYYIPNLIIKRIMLIPYLLRSITNLRFIKRLPISFGQAIGCPSITYVKKKAKNPLFSQNPNLMNDVDWNALEILSRVEGRFVYITKFLMGHRIHKESQTSAMIVNNQRHQEDIIILKKFWPSFLANLIAKIYKLSEVSNNV